MYKVRKHGLLEKGYNYTLDLALWKDKIDDNNVPVGCKG